MFPAWNDKGSTADLRSKKGETYEFTFVCFAFDLGICRNSQTFLWDHSRLLAENAEAKPKGFCYPNGNNGIHLGQPDRVERGEILRPTRDELRRKRLTGWFPSIKNESVGIEDDQIPS